MSYFGLSFWSIEEKKNLGVVIVQGDDIQTAVAKSQGIFPPEVNEGRAVAVASEIPEDKIKYFPIEMFDKLIDLDKLKQYYNDHPCPVEEEEEEKPTLH